MISIHVSRRASPSVQNLNDSSPTRDGNILFNKRQQLDCCALVHHYFRALWTLLAPIALVDPDPSFGSLS